MRQSDRMVLTAILRVGSTIVVGMFAYFVSLGVFSTAISNNVSPNYAYGGTIFVFVAILAVWIGKLAVRIEWK